MQAICTGYNCSGWPAYSLLLFGWMAPFAASANMGWWANPTLMVSWVMGWNGRNSSAVALAVIALGFCLLPWLFPVVMVNEGGITGDIDGYRSGYFLWLVSAIVNLCTQFALLHLARTE
ncbi:hypothetical protein [Novosphingobium humi]|uniref:SPW repeat-containing protein n=1 Tax=Novosphingobium humi TaxID=2282397 RepID=A0ABY7TXB8_9SPHN|nr:hypothetical protein [Novosphingobium humi]WCT77912.1 hypothetical protein PQ457_02760 [Novosphingobium humi]